VCAVVLQHRLLGGGGEQPVSGHTNTLSDSADISGATRRFIPGLMVRPMARMWGVSIFGMSPDICRRNAMVGASDVSQRPGIVPGTRIRPDCSCRAHDEHGADGIYGQRR
jgi:hypothetical protein